MTDIPLPGRRTFLQRLAAGGAAALLWPTSLERLADRLTSSGLTPGAPDYWGVVRDAFLIPDDRIFLNPSTLGAQPRVVLDAAVQAMRRTAMTYPPGVDWDALKARMGDFVNGDPAGFVFTRNTTESMNFVANGLELRPGDEILTTDQEHIGGLCCWQLAAKRRHLTLRQLPIPVPPTDAGQIVDVFRKAITRKTRVMSFSHVTFTTGLKTPVKALVALARAHGIIAVVDGAHPPGMMEVDLRDLDPDFYASSPHKWLCAPQGTGTLYLREEWRTKLWPSVASGDWDDLKLGAQRYNYLGTIDESRLAGLDAALQFQQTIGKERVAARVRELRHHLYQQLSRVPGLHIYSPPGDDLAAGMVSFKVDGTDSLELQRRLARKARVRSRVVSEYGYGFMRLSPHIYNSPEEIDRVAELIREET